MNSYLEDEIDVYNETIEKQEINNKKISNKTIGKTNFNECDLSNTTYTNVFFEDVTLRPDPGFPVCVSSTGNRWRPTGYGPAGGL